MKIKFVFATLIVAVTFLTVELINAEMEKKMNVQTIKNLSTAMHGEAFAYAKYLLFAEHARQNGNTKVADLFESTAKTERFEHFSEEAQLAGLVGSDSDNLKDAIEGESYETETMYREFAQQAKQAGDLEAAKRFEEIRLDEAKHRDAFNAVLNELKK
jgi:rubrerythrin